MSVLIKLETNDDMQIVEHGTDIVLNLTQVT